MTTLQMKQYLMVIVVIVLSVMFPGERSYADSSRQYSLMSSYQLENVIDVLCTESDIACRADIRKSVIYSSHTNVPNGIIVRVSETKNVIRSACAYSWDWDVQNTEICYSNRVNTYKLN